MQGEKPTFDPFATVQIVSTRDDSVSAVCFADKKFELERISPDDIISTSSSDDEDEFVLPSQNLLSKHSNNTSAVYITGQRNGNTYIWKGHNRLRPLAPNRGGTCLTLQRAGASRVLLQTKDEAGTVSFHDLETNSIVSSIETRSRTFCAAVSYSHDLTVLPTSVESVVQLFDERQSSAKTMVFHAAGLSPKDENLRKYGMTSSLAVDASVNIIACGMESGHVFYHDIRMEARVCSSVHLESSDPIICLGIKGHSENDSIVTVAGQAGDKEDQNTISWVESKRDAHHLAVESRVRTQLSTSRTGKTGVSSARLLSERLVAVGGWDGRLRVFNRSKLMALGRAHTGSIQSLDWYDSYVITGGVDGRVLLWDISAFQL